MSDKDKKVAHSISKAENSKIETIRSIMNIKAENFSVYRDRLIKKGIITSPSYGHLEFILPRFKEFVLRMMDFDA